MSLSVIKNNKIFPLVSLLVIITGLVIYAIYSIPNVKEQKTKPNIIMISLTNLPTNHMSGYGYKRKTTPNLDKFAAKSLVFENNFSHASWTLPTAASVFTSTYPYNHRLMYRYGRIENKFDRNNRLPKELRTFAEILKVYKYQTAAFTGGGDFRKGHGLERGFDEYDGSGNFLSFKRSITKAKKWLNAHKKERFFLFLQGYDMHAPFTPPKPYDKKFWKDSSYKPKFDKSLALRGFSKVGESNKYRAYYYEKGAISPAIDLDATDIKFLESQYDGEVAYVDNLIGNFLNGIDTETLRNTYIVISSEHGEMFGKHGRFGRAGTIRGTFYDDVMKVPLIIKTPKQGRGKKINKLTQLIDIAPTILDWLELQKPAQFQGKSLLPLINKNRSINSYVFAGSDFGRVTYDLYDKVSRSEMIRNRQWKLIREIILEKGKVKKETLELYNIKRDKDEQTNLADKYPLLTKELKTRLFRWAQKSSSKYRGQYYPIPKELEEEAKKHGYW